MTYALVAIASSAATAYILSPPVGEGGFQFGMLTIFTVAIIAACLKDHIE